MAGLTEGVGGVSETAEMANALTSFIRRYVVLSADQLAAVALWTLHTHTFEASGRRRATARTCARC
jgi:hypothetical protein